MRETHSNFYTKQSDCELLFPQAYSVISSGGLHLMTRILSIKFYTLFGLYNYPVSSERKKIIKKYKNVIALF